MSATTSRMTEHREKVVAFVVTRLSSSRLPRKQLRTIADVSVLDRIMATLRAVDVLDDVIVTTVAEPANEPLRTLAEQRNWPLFWYEGEVDDVVGRLNHAADAYAADICLLISADCPLVHGPSVAELVEHIRQSPQADYLLMPPDAQGRASLLEGVHIARRAAWQRADALSDRPELREHQFPVIYQHPEMFKRVDVQLSTAIYGEPHRLSIDTWADLEFMETLYQRLRAESKAFDLPAVVDLLARDPAMRAINQHVHQRRLVETVHRVLFVIDAGGPFGYGHLMRCRELAGQIVERLGWPVTFVLDDQQAAESVEACGFHVAWGALGRPSGEAIAPWQAAQFDELVDAHGVIIVDISAQRQLDQGWRAQLATDRPVVVVDRQDGVANEADLIVCPGVSGRPSESPEAMPPTVGGLPFAIIRREVRRYVGLDLDKDIDLLVYLYAEDQRDAVRQLAASNGWRVLVLDAFREDFAELPARSRVFLSGYGQTFYEALALGCFPVAWPLSSLHQADAQAFYAAAGLPETIVRQAGDLNSVLGAALSYPMRAHAPLIDGTPQIVQRLAELREHWS